MNNVSKRDSINREYIMDSVVPDAGIKDRDK